MDGSERSASLALTRSASMPTPIPLPSANDDDDDDDADAKDRPLHANDDDDEHGTASIPAARSADGITGPGAPVEHEGLGIRTTLPLPPAPSPRKEPKKLPLPDLPPFDPAGLPVSTPTKATTPSTATANGLPPTPAQTSASAPSAKLTSGSNGTPAHRSTDRSSRSAPPFSLWDYLREEVLATDFDSTQEIKWERVSNFMAVPFAVEKIMLFGMAVCLDSFLYTFTILPLRFCVAIYRLGRNYSLRILNPSAPHRYLSSSHKCDILKLTLVITSCVILSHFTDASKMYHSVRGQDVVKLSVIFNVLEIADRLCCSLGQDLLDSLFSRTTLARRRQPDGSTRQPVLRPATYFVLALIYVLAHTLVLLYQLVTLNVAINAFDNALLTLLLSNQFVEIKGSVFKKFEKENLFQLTCADIVERFQLGFLLFAIGTRNLIELSGGAPSPISFARSTSASVSAAVSHAAANPASMLSPLPTSFTILPSLSLLETVLSPVLIVIASECLVDALKHAFIGRFNHFRPAVYGRFMDVLCSDLVVDGWSPSSLSNAFASANTKMASSRTGRGSAEKTESVKREDGLGGGAGSHDSTITQLSSSRRSDGPLTSTVPFPNDGEPSEKNASSNIPTPGPNSTAAPPNTSTATPSASASTSAGTSTSTNTTRRARKHTFVDQSPLVARRLGFAALPLACLIVRMTQQILGMLSGDESDFDECIVRPSLISGLRKAGGGASASGSGSGAGGAGSPSAGLGWVGWLLLGLRGARGGHAIDAQRMGAALLDGAAHIVGFTLVFVIPWAFLIMLKLLLGMKLAAYAAKRHATSPTREREEALNARNRPPIGVGAEELAYEARVSALLDEHGGDYAEGWNLRGEAVLPPFPVRKSGILTGAPGTGGAFVDARLAEGGKGAGAAGGNGSKGGGGSKGESLMDVSRYTMVRSRIW